MSGVSYATLAQLRTENKSGVTTDDTVMLDYARRATAAIDQYVSRRYVECTFAPRRVTRYFDCLGPNANITQYGKRLELDSPWVAFTSVTDGASTVLVDGTDYFVLPRGVTPYTALYRFDGTLWTTYSGDTYMQQIAIVGDLCYRTFYADAWVTATTLGAAVSDTTGTTITTASNTILSPGMLIRIDSEWMTVESGSTTTWVVNRGERGSTAATHSNGATVSRFIPEPTITRAVMRWAGLLYARRGAYETTRFDGTASVEFVEDMPKEVSRSLDEIGRGMVRPVLA